MCRVFFISLCNGASASSLLLNLLFDLLLYFNVMKVDMLFLTTEAIHPNDVLRSLLDFVFVLYFKRPHKNQPVFVSV